MLRKDHTTITIDPINQSPVNSSSLPTESYSLIQHPPYDLCCERVRPLRPLLYVAPFSTAIKEAADIAMSLFRDKNSSTATVAIGASTAFLASIELTGGATIRNFNESCFILKTHHFPDSWPILPTNQNIKSIGLTIIPSLYGVFSEGVQTYYFIVALPTEYPALNKMGSHVFKGLGGFLGAGAALTILLTDDMEMFKTVRTLCSGETRNYTHVVSKYLSPLIGISLSSLKAFQDSIDGYIAIKSIFELSGAAAIGISVLSFGNTIPSLCFRAPLIIDLLDGFFNFILCKEKITFLQGFAFSISLGLAVYLAYLKMGLNIAFYQDICDELSLAPDNVSHWIKMLAGAMFVQESLLTAEVFNEPMHHLFSLVKKPFTQLSDYFYHYFSPKPNPEITINLESSLIIQAQEDTDQIAIDCSPKENHPPDKKKNGFSSLISKDQPHLSSREKLFPKFHSYQNNHSPLMFNQFRRLREKKELKTEEKNTKTCFRY